MAGAWQTKQPQTQAKGVPATIFQIETNFAVAIIQHNIYSNIPKQSNFVFEF